MRPARAALALWCGPAAARTISRVELTSGDPHQSLLLADAPVLAVKLEAFRGRPDNAAVREAIADEILRHYQAAGWPVTDVAVTGASGTLTASIHEGRYGTITVTGGSEWIRRAAFADWSRREGHPLTNDGLAANLAWLHRNPLHAATIGFTPGAAPATADATLTLQDTRPVRLYAGWRDDGAPPLDRDRFMAGVEVADVFGLPWERIPRPMYPLDPIDDWRSARS